MAFVNVPKDLARVKAKVALNLTRRQLVCFGSAAIIGVPLYLLTRGAIGNSAAALLMMAAMFPFFFTGVYEKDGLPAEKILLQIVRARFAWPGIRPYRTENLYEILGKEADSNAAEERKAGGGQSPAGGKNNGRQGKAAR